MGDNHADDPKVIILNKPFLGDWLNVDGHIGHEVIDFILTDKGERYVYNLPWGICPDDIWVQGTHERDDFKRKKKERYVAEYLLLTSEKRNGRFFINYVIRLAEKLHRAHTRDDYKDKRFVKDRDNVSEIVNERDIKYDGTSLNDIFDKDDGLLNVTFKAEAIFHPKEPILIEGLDYNYQRNKGYIHSDTNSRDYETIIKAINDSDLIEDRTDRIARSYKKDTTFLDLIGMQDNEQVFTNLLFNCLNHQDMMARFCKKFKKKDDELDNTSFTVEREKTIQKGRMDICGYSENQRVIIENKVYSNLNGLKKDGSTQLDAYYKWGKRCKMKPLCFITVPDYRLSSVRNDVSSRNTGMADVYQFVTYGQIASFLKENKKVFDDWHYNICGLFDQTLSAFENHSYTELEYYTKLFLDLIQRKKNEPAV